MSKQKKISSEEKILRLSDDVSLRRLEEYYVYNRLTDELYEIDASACDFLKKCDGYSSVIIKEADREFIDFCITEGIVAELKEPAVKKEIAVYSSDHNPSLRYLELIVTDKCNLSCKHCYLDKSCGTELPFAVIKNIFGEFQSAGGMRLMISGGEPLIHSDFKKINELIYYYDFRAALLTNGTLLNKYIISELNFKEVQISIDGLKNTHDLIRGNGSYEKAMNSIKLLVDSGIDVSVATMILKSNTEELEELGRIVNDIGVKKWEVDVPCGASSSDIFLDYKTAGKYFKYGFAQGGLSAGFYNSSGDYACGAHLMAVMNTEKVCKCSFFADNPVGDISSGLIHNFAKLKKMKLSEIECDCDFVKECRGGCRYRAALVGGLEKKDIAKCSYYLL